MSLPAEVEDDFAIRRTRLARMIAQQRNDLAHAYLQLEKPIRYTEYGMRGFGFIRQNPWIMAAVPAVFSLVSTAFGWKKKKPAPAQFQAPAPKPTGPAGKISRIGQAAMTGVEHGLRLYNLYRRVRSILP